MTITLDVRPAIVPCRGRRATVGFSPPATRAALTLIVAVAALAGFLAGDAVATARAVSGAGEDLTRLLRAMALIKAGMASAVTAAVIWRLGLAVTAPRFAAYALACAAMAAGPGLIWNMTQVGVGAVLLHGGLFGAIVLFWRDRVVGERFGEIIAARRARLAERVAR
jgi:hypothetical protein